jgi:hypothetical protein
LNQILVGQHIEATKSYAMGLIIIGLAPMAGLVAPLLYWPRFKSSPVEP